MNRLNKNESAIFLNVFFVVSLMCFFLPEDLRGWGGAKVLVKLSMPGRPTNLNNSRARAYCVCSRCGWGQEMFGIFFSRLSFLFSSSLPGRRLDKD